MDNKSVKNKSEDISAIISEQMENQVAFFNIKDKNAFFFITPEEARVAIDYIKQWRIDGFNTKKRHKELDDYVQSFNDSYESMYKYSFREFDEGRNIFQVSASNFLTFLNHACIHMESRSRFTDAFVMNAKTYSNVRCLGKAVYDDATEADRIERGIVGHIYTGDIYLCNKMEDDEVLLISQPRKEDEKDMSRSTSEKFMFIKCIWVVTYTGKIPVY